MLTRSRFGAVAALVVLFIGSASSYGQITYQLDDGTVEDGVGVGGTVPYDIIWLNQFPVLPGGERITSIQATFGSPPDPRNYNAIPISILLYQDANGGSTTDAVLLTSINSTITNSGGLIFNSYDIPDTNVTGNILIGVLARDLPGGNSFVASIDTTDPDVPARSFLGITIGAPLNQNDLSSIGANYNAIENFGISGNWAVRATGVPIPEPGSLSLLAIGAAGGAWLRRRRTRAAA